MREKQRRRSLAIQGKHFSPITDDAVEWSMARDHGGIEITRDLDRIARTKLVRHGFVIKSLPEAGEALMKKKRNGCSAAPS